MNVPEPIEGPCRRQSIMKIATPIAIWDYVPNPSRVMPVTYALSNGFGLGGDERGARIQTIRGMKDE